MWKQRKCSIERIKGFFFLTYPKGYYMNMMSDLKDMTRHHNYQMGELLELTPFDYQVIKIMIIQDINKEMDNNK